ncbi:MAG TPA: hypothetical protein VHM94_11000 [Acidimicrobiia bacterium]|nr:hypothetical protein [Acidimicrobiia bacterium]
MEPLQLAQGLGVVGGGVDQLHAQLGETLLEGNLDPVQPPGEAQTVVRQHLAGQPVAGGGGLEGVPPR